MHEVIKTSPQQHVNDAGFVGDTLAAAQVAPVHAA
jgi:hypothetical protein